MHPPHVRAAALELIAAGHNDCEVARITGLARTTVRDWRRPTYVLRRPELPSETCPRCWRGARPIRFDADGYTELLGLYLGDGCISEHPRAYRLRIALDAKYPQIIEDAAALLRRGFPFNAVDIVRTGVKGKLVNISTYSQHLPCLLPQHGRGKKHERPILLEPWQVELLDEAPWPFIRGCIRSDGSCFISRTDVHRPQPYEYVSYAFSNKSGDIVELFVEACDRVSVFTRTNFNRGRDIWQVRINRRESVSLMLEHVGRKGVRR